MSDSNAIIDLQMTVMEQEQSIETLSQQLLRQSEKMEQLNKKISVLEMKLIQFQQFQSESGSEPMRTGAEDERPPHY